MITYELLQELDPEEVRAAVTAAGDTHTFGDLSEARFDQLLSRPDLLPDACWTARIEDGLAGLVVAAAAETAVRLQLLAVRREFRRAGVGRGLLTRVVEAARTHGLAELRTVTVDTRDEGACAFFHAMGWEAEDTGGLRMRRDLRDLGDLPDLTRGIPVADGYLVRTFQEGDAEAWVRMRNAAFATETHSNEAWTLETFEKSFRNDPVFSPDRVFLAVRESDAEVAGTTSSWDYQVDGRTVGLIHWVAVAPEHRGKKLGVALMLAALRDMRARGHTEAYLNTNSGLRHAVQLYESLGFTPVQRRVLFRLRLLG